MDKDLGYSSMAALAFLESQHMLHHLPVHHNTLEDHGEEESQHHQYYWNLPVPSVSSSTPSTSIRPPPSYFHHYYRPPQIAPQPPLPPIPPFPHNFHTQRPDYHNRPSYSTSPPSYPPPPPPPMPQSSTPIYHHQHHDNSVGFRGKNISFVQKYRNATSTFPQEIKKLSRHPFTYLARSLFFYLIFFLVFFSIHRAHSKERKSHHKKKKKICSLHFSISFKISMSHDVRVFSSNLSRE